MALADIRQRPGVLLGAAVLLHVVLISAQVNTASGLPVLQVVTFGSFAEVQRGTTAAFDSVRNLWSGYIALRHVNAENTALKHELQTLQVRLQEERALAQRTDSLTSCWSSLDSAVTVRAPPRKTWSRLSSSLRRKAAA